MKALKILSGVALLAASLSTSSQTWIKMNVEASDVTTYSDVASVEGDSRTKKMWMLNDFKNPSTRDYSYGALSSKVLFEYNCLNDTQRIVKLFFYDKNMGAGAVLNGFEKNTDWTDIVPGSISDTVVKVICNKNR